MNTLRGYIVNKFRHMSDVVLIEAMTKNIRLAKSFNRRRCEGYTGDTWLGEAWDMSRALEDRGYTVREDWVVFNHNGERVS